MLAASIVGVIIAINIVMIRRRLGLPARAGVIFQRPEYHTGHLRVGIRIECSQCFTTTGTVVIGDAFVELWIEADAVAIRIGEDGSAIVCDGVKNGLTVLDGDDVTAIGQNESADGQ